MDADEIKQELSWIETALQNPNSVEHKIYLSNVLRKDLITRWATNLELLHEAGEYHKDINTISTHISDKFRTWKMDNAIHYVSEVLDFKYKNPNKMNYPRVEQPHKDSSELLSFEATNSNQTLIQYLTSTVEALKSNIDRLKKDVFLESKIPEKELEQLCMNWDHIIKRHQEAWDGREKVLSTTQHLMAFALSQFSLNHSYVEYVRYAKEDTKLTEKQASKMARLQTNKVDELFNPKTFAEAKELGFYGQQCEKCGSWRTEKRYNPSMGDYKDQLYCFAIHTDKDKDNWSVLKTLKMEEVVIQ